MSPIDLTLSSEDEGLLPKSKPSAAFILRNGNVGGYESYEERRPHKKRKHFNPPQTQENESSAERMRNEHARSQIVPFSTDPTRTLAVSDLLESNQNKESSRPVHTVKLIPNWDASSQDHVRAPDATHSGVLGLKRNEKTSRSVHSAEQQRRVYASKNARTPNLSSLQMNVLRSELPSTKEQGERRFAEDGKNATHQKASSDRTLDDRVSKLSLQQDQGTNVNKPREGKAGKDASGLINGKPTDRKEHKDAPNLTKGKAHGPPNSAHSGGNINQQQSRPLKDKPRKSSVPDSQPRHKNALNANLSPSRGNLLNGIQSGSQARASSSSSKAFEETKAKPLERASAGREPQAEIRTTDTSEPITPPFLSPSANSTVLSAAFPPERPDKPSLTEPQDETAGLKPDTNMPPLSWEAVESVLRQHIKELQTHQESLTKTCLAHARCCIEDIETVPKAFLQTQSPFTDMKEDKPEEGGLIHSQDLWVPSKTKSIRTTSSCATISYASRAVNVPPFTSYIDLRSNMLAENDQRLFFWPYFDDDEEGQGRDRLPEELSDKYIMLADNRPTTILQNERVRKLESCVKNFLAEIGCDLNDILRCLLDPSPKIDVGLSSNALRAWLSRDKHFDDDFNRTSEKWSMVFLTKLHPFSDRAMEAAALACAVFLKVCGFSLWPIAKKSLKTETTHSSQHNSQPPSTSCYATMACRICQVHDCTHHGELVEALDPKPDDLSSVDVSDSDDGDINHRARVNPGSYNNMSEITAESIVYRGKHNISETLGIDSEGNVEAESGEAESGGSPSGAYLPDNKLCSEKCFWKKSNRTGSASRAWSAADTALLKSVYPACATDRRGPCMVASIMDKLCIEIFWEMVILADNNLADNNLAADPSTTRRAPPTRSTAYWLQNSETHLITQRAPFYPCNHSGTCESAQCRCFQQQVTCEKTCACSANCSRRFRGCRCSQVGQVCFQSPKCACFTLNRECDADLCGTCGAAEVLDPDNRYNDEAAKCTNVCIQKNMPKRTLLGHSEVHGFGLFMGEPVKAHEYLGEYKGEILTKGESNRRSTIYAYQRTNYTFDLNKDQEIDSTRCGNKFRFINNSEVDATINCYAKITLCNTVTRIGMFANRDIQVGEELFFNYGYVQTPPYLCVSPTGTMYVPRECLS